MSTGSCRTSRPYEGFLNASQGKGKKQGFIRRVKHSNVRFRKSTPAVGAEAVRRRRTGSEAVGVKQARGDSEQKSGEI